MVIIFFTRARLAASVAMKASAMMVMIGKRLIDMNLKHPVIFLKAKLIPLLPALGGRYSLCTLLLCAVCR